MVSRSRAQMACLVATAALVSACDATLPRIGDPGAKTVATGSTAGSTAVNANPQLEKCARPLGTLSLVEDQQAEWFRYFTDQYKLTSTVPLLRLMVQQSNCFIVVDRGRAMANMQQERALAASGELRTDSRFGKGQMVSADYSVTPEVLMSQRGTSGGGFGTLIGQFSPVAGALASTIQTNEASTLLTLVDNRSGVQLAAAEGSSRNTDFAFAGMLGGSSAAAGLGGYTNTPQGKVIAAAFMNAYNQMVIAARGYTPQSMGQQALGTGGNLKVDGAPPPAPRDAPATRSGGALKEAQVRLVQLGYDAGTPDGQLGRKTVAALREFQKDRQLPITGQLDGATREALSR